MAMSRPLRLSLIALGALLGLVAILVAAGYGALQTSWAHKRIAAAIEDALGSDALTIRIGSLDGTLPDTIVLHDVTATDASGQWAEIGRMEVAWRPWQLLFKTIDVKTLSVSDATLERLPHGPSDKEPPAAPRASPFNLPDIGIEIAKMSIDMKLGTALTDGKVEALRADGSARYGMGDGIDLNLDANQGGTGGSRLTARLHANPDDETLDLEVHAHEAKGGLVSRLIGVAEDGPFDVDITGDGSLMDWNGTAKASLGPDGHLDAKIRAFGDTMPRFAVTGRASVPAPLGGRLQRVGAPPYDFDVEFVVADDGSLAFKNTTIKSAGASMVANGSVDLSSGSIDMTLALTPTGAGVRNALIEPFSAPSLALNAHVRGYVNAPYVEVSAAMPSLTGEGLSAGRANLTAELDFDTGDPATLFTFDASANIAKLAFAPKNGQPASPPSDILMRTKGAYRGTAQRVSFGDLMLRSDWASVDFAGGLNLSGEAAAMLNGRLTAELRGLPMAGPEVAKFLKQPARLQSSVVYMPEGERLKFAKLNLDHPKITAEGDVEVGLDPQSIRGNLKARIADPASFSDLAGTQLAGAPIDITLATAPSGSMVNSTLGVSTASLTISGTRLRQLKASLTLKDVETQSGTLDLAFTGPAGAVKAVSQISRSQNPDRLSFRELKLTAAGGELNGNLSIPLEGGPATGMLEGQFASLDAVSALTGTDLNGAATFQVSLSDIGGQQGATGHIEGNDLSVMLEKDRAVGVKHVTVATSGDVARLTQGVPYSVNATGVSYGDVTLDNLALSGTTNFHRADYKIDADGHYHGSMSVSAAGSADWDKPEKHVDIETLTGMHRKTALALMKPASLILSDTGLEVKPTMLQIGDGHVDLSLKRDGRVLEGHVDLADFPLNVMRAFTSASPAAGKLSGTVDVSVGPKGRSGSAKFQAAGLALSPGDAAQAQLDGTLNAKWRDDNLSLKGEFSGQGDAKIALNASMPLNYVSNSGVFELPDNGRLRGDLTWNADVGPFWNAFGPDTQTLQGRVDASLTLGGTVGDPTATGDIMLHDGRYVNLEMGTVLDKLALRLEANRREVKLIEASATDGGSGKVTASGTIGLDSDDDFPIKLDLTADKATLVRRTDVTATASGKLSFTKDGKTSLLQGKIKTDRVDAILVDMSSPDVVNLKVTEIGPDGQVINKPRQQEESELSESATKLDIDVDVPGQAFIRGRGLDSEWKGNLKVTGPLEDPRIVGTFNVVRGNFKFAGRSFDLQRGQVSFQGGKKIDPDLNVQAVYEVQDLTATASITGPSSSPKVTLSSTPAYPQDEVLSRILFGSSVADLTPLQAVQLADAIRGLGKPGGGLLGSARNVVGLDVLQVGSSQSGGGLESTTVTGGKYITKNVYLEVEAAPDGSQEQVGVDVGLTKHLSVESDVSPQQGTRVGLKWKRDY